MREAAKDGRLQVTAAASLLENSRLVVWQQDQARFVATSQHNFESSWRRDVDPVFGRLICWINFAAGAEFLAKGVCLTRGIEVREEQQVPVYPNGDLTTWARRFRENGECDGTFAATDFGMLGALTQGNTPALERLCAVVKATTEQQDIVIAGYDLLRRTIRNRDAHAYVPNVRDSHFLLVPKLFAKCFNVLVAWLPGGPQTLNIWRAEAGSFIASL